MKSYYEHMHLPQPVLPSLQHLALLKGQTALVTGANSGIGASHQTGWTGCVARIIQTQALLTPELLLAPGAEAAAFKLLQASGMRPTAAKPARRA